MKVKLDESQVVPWCKCIAAAALAVSSNSSMQAMASVCPGARNCPVGEAVTRKRRSLSA